jgi:hypothetical protein
LPFHNYYTTNQLKGHSPGVRFPGADRTTSSGLGSDEHHQWTLVPRCEQHAAIDVRCVSIVRDPRPLAGLAVGVLEFDGELAEVGLAAEVDERAPRDADGLAVAPLGEANASHHALVDAACHLVIQAPEDVQSSVDLCVSFEQYGHLSLPLLRYLRTFVQASHLTTQT